MRINNTTVFINQNNVQYTFSSAEKKRNIVVCFKFAVSTSLDAFSNFAYMLL